MQRYQTFSVYAHQPPIPSLNSRAVASRLRTSFTIAQFTAFATFPSQSPATVSQSEWA
jgi:hypothetical protein